MRNLFILLLLGLFTGGITIAQPAHHFQKRPNAGTNVSPDGAQQNTDPKAVAANLLDKANNCLVRRQYPEALAYYDSLKNFSIRHRLTEPASEAINAIEEMYLIQGKSLGIIQLNKEVSRFFQENNLPDELHSHYMALGASYNKLGNFDSSYTFLHTALEYFKQTGNQRQYMICCSFMGRYYGSIHDWEKAAEYEIGGMNIARMLNDTNAWTIANIRIAGLFGKQHQWDLKEKYAREALVLAEVSGWKYLQAMALNELADVQMALKNTPEAIKLYERSAALTDSVRFLKACDTYLALARIYAEQQQTEKALVNLGKARSIADKQSLDGNSAEIDYMYGDIELKKGHLKKALNFYETGYQRGLNLHDLIVQQNGLIKLAKLAETAGQPMQALQYLRQYLTIKDSIFTASKIQAGRELEARFQLQQKEQRITLLDAENTVKDLRLENADRTQTALLIGLTGLLVLALGGWYLFRLKQKNSQQLEEKNAVISKALAEKDLLLREIHHRVKNNLQVISSLLKLQGMHLEDHGALEALNEGRNRVQSMALIHQNLYQEDHMTAIEAPGYVKKLTETLFRAYNIQPDKVLLQTQIDPLLLDVDTAVPLGLILNELISNALKHAWNGIETGELKVFLGQPNENELLMRVSDNGIGGLARNLFEDEVRRQSFGVNLVRMLAEKLDAVIQIPEGAGTTVELRIRQFKLA